MEIYTVNRKYMAFSLSGCEILGEAEAESFVKKLLEQWHLPCWQKIAIEVFAGQDEALYLAHPAPEIKISVAPYLLPFLGEYFTE